MVIAPIVFFCALFCQLSAMNLSNDHEDAASPSAVTSSPSFDEEMLNTLSTPIQFLRGFEQTHKTAQQCFNSLTQAMTTQDDVMAVASSTVAPYGALICIDKTVIVNYADRTKDFCINHTTQSIRSIVFSPDGLHAAFITSTGACWIFNINTHQYTPAKNTNAISAAFSHDSKYLACLYSLPLADAKLIRLVNLETGKVKEHHPYDHDQNNLNEIMFDSSGKLLGLSIAPNGWMRCYRADTDEVLYGGYDITLSPRADRVIYHNGNETTITDIEKNKPIVRFPYPIESTSFSRNRRIIAFVSHERSMVGIIDEVTKEIIFSLRCEQNSIRAIALSPDARSIAIAMHDKTIRIIRVSDKKTACTIQHTKLVDTMVFDPYQKSLIIENSSDDMNKTVTEINLENTSSHICQIAHNHHAHEGCSIKRGFPTAEFTYAQCTLLCAMHIAKQDTERLRHKKNTKQTARIHAHEKQWETWLQLRSVLPERTIKNLERFIVRSTPDNSLPIQDETSKK